ncbi:MAG: NUDIX hydrolase [Proteobacteria bacterium]|jgi:ADP-ribose pyrophosphatase YjhB (NUDIX family)|nr:NUDIX hydrolase [Pseudomonadota bacterium]
MEDSWLAMAKKLHAIASTGMFFGESEFDKERYAEISEIASQMLADLGQKPISQLPDLFPDFAKGYATPKVDVRAAIIRDNQILLVREVLDGLWTLPGGYADVGLSAAENTVKEVKEESGLNVSIRQLIGVFHKAKHEYAHDVRDFYKFYFLCDEVGTGEPETGPETSDVGFFNLDSLPPLSLGRSIHKHIELAFEFNNNPQSTTVFD